MKKEEGQFFGKVWSLSPHVSNVLPLLPGLGPKRRKGMPTITAILGSSASQRSQSILKAEQITLRWIRATVKGLPGFGLHTPQLWLGKLYGLFVNLTIM